MKIKVTVVDSEAEYNTWLASQAPLVSPVIAEESQKEEKDSKTEMGEMETAMLTNNPSLN